MRRFNIKINTRDYEYHLRHVNGSIWEMLSKRGVKLLRKDGTYSGISFANYGTYYIGDRLSFRVLTQITRDRFGRIFLYLIER